MENNKETLRFYKMERSYTEVIEQLEDDEQLRCYKAMTDYMFHDIEPNFEDNRTLRLLFIQIMSGLRKTKEAGLKAVKSSQENGKKGGRPPKSKEEDNLNEYERRQLEIYGDY